MLANELLDVASPDYPDEAFDRWAEYEQANAYWFRPRARLIAWALRHHFPTARSFFEAGCGSGAVLETIARDPELELIVGGDASLEGLRLSAKRAPGAQLIQLDAHRMPFRDEFDVVGAFDVIEHFDDDVGVLAGLTEVVKPGGGVLITVPQHPWLWSEQDEVAEHKRRYRRRELLAKVEGVGIEVLMTTSYVFAPLPALVLSRLRRRSEGYDPIAEGIKGVPLAGLLGRILEAEVGAIQRGVSLPAGGSLVLVGRRS